MSIREALAEVAQMLSADGAALVVNAVDDGAATARVRLDLDGVECGDCVLAPEILQATIDAAVSRRAGRAVNVEIDDPRVRTTAIVLSPVAEILGG